MSLSHYVCSHLAFSVVGIITDVSMQLRGFETCVHIYHANSQLSEISPHAFFQKAMLPEGRTFCLINPSELTRCRHLSYSVVGIVKTEKDFFRKRQFANIDMVEFNSRKMK